MSQPEHVALIHGYLANKFLLAPLARRLRRRGYGTTPWGSWNIQCSLLVHADRFSRELERLDADPTIDTIHVVTHSMGGIVTRAALDRYRPRKLGRLVMLAPPNHGSFVATQAVNTFGRFLRPVTELSTAADSLVNLLPTPQGLDIGVIAAQYDALVSEESTHPDVPHAHVTLPTWHTGLLFSRAAATLVAAFLASGTFDVRQSASAIRQTRTTETVRSKSDTA